MKLSTIVIFLIFFTVAIGLIQYCVKLETIDQKKLKIVYNEHIRYNDEAMEYLNWVSHYPTWRLAVLMSFIPIIFIFPIIIHNHKDINENDMINLSFQVILIFLIFYITLVKFMDYFRWHIMCHSFGCTKNNTDIPMNE